jgi:hypothetical protein
LTSTGTVKKNFLPRETMTVDSWRPWSSLNLIDRQKFEVHFLIRGIVECFSQFVSQNSVDELWIDGTAGGSLSVHGLPGNGDG